MGGEREREGGRGGVGGRKGDKGKKKKLASPQNLLQFLKYFGSIVIDINLSHIHLQSMFLKCWTQKN